MDKRNEAMVRLSLHVHEGREKGKSHEITFTRIRKLARHIETATKRNDIKTLDVTSLEIAPIGHTNDECVGDADETIW